VFAQTPVPSESGDQAGTPVLTNPLPLQLTVVSTPTTFTTCLLVTATDVEGFNPTGSVPSGAVCYQVVQTSDAVLVDPKYTVGVSNSSGNAAAIAGAVIGSILGATLLVLCFIYWRKRAVRKRQMTSHASRGWTQRSGGWIDDRKPEENIDLQNWPVEDSRPD